MTQQPEPTQPLDMSKVFDEETEDPEPKRVDGVGDPAPDNDGQ